MRSTALHSTTHPIAPDQLSPLTIPLERTLGHASRIGNAIPPTGLVLLSSFAVQLSMAWATTLFDAFGVIGAAFVCKATAVLLLLLVVRPKLGEHSWRDYIAVFFLGAAIATMSPAFYAAIERIPLGVAATLEFLGPLSVAVIGSRRWVDLVWVFLAATGVILLHPSSQAALDPIGIELALLAAGCWAMYIWSSSSVGRTFPGKEGLVLAMSVGTLLMMPLGVVQAGSALLHPDLLAIGVGVAVVGTVVPYTLEFSALKQLPPKTFGVLMSVEPAIAALVGFLFLGEVLNWQTVLAIAVVTLAAVGATLFGKSNADE